MGFGHQSNKHIHEPLCVPIRTVGLGITDPSQANSRFESEQYAGLRADESTLKASGPATEPARSLSEGAAGLLAEAWHLRGSTLWRHRGHTESAY